MSLRRVPIGLILFALSVPSAFAAPPDSAFDAIEAKLAGKDAAGALALLDQLTDLTPGQQVRAAYDRAQADQSLGKADDAIADLLKVVPTPDATVEQRMGFVSTGGAFGEQARAL